MNTYHRTALAALALAPALVLTYCSRSNRTSEEVANASVQCILDMETVLRDVRTENAQTIADRLGDIHTELQAIRYSLSQMSHAQKSEVKELVEMQHSKVAEPMLQCTVHVAGLEKANYLNCEELKQVTQDIRKTMREIEQLLK